MRTEFLLVAAIVTISAVTLFENAQAEITFDDYFTRGEYSYPSYGQKYYGYKYEPSGSLGEETFDTCKFMVSFTLSQNQTGSAVYKFPKDMIWAGSDSNSTFFIARSTANAFQDSMFEKLEPQITSEEIMFEFDLKPGLNTFIANSTNFWDFQNSKPIECTKDMYSKQDVKYYDFVFPLKIQKQYVQTMNLDEDYLCKSGLDLTQKYDGSPACVKPQTRQKLIERGWAKSQS